jgi:hypothetical protein
VSLWSRGGVILCKPDLSTLRVGACTENFLARMTVRFSLVELKNLLS